MAHHILYYPKHTSAHTVYLELPDEDLAWLKTELIRWLAVMTESDTRTDAEWAQVLSQYWNRKTRTLPSSQQGLNTPATFVAGLINNLVFGTQRDITQRQMEGIRDISSNLAHIVPSIDTVVFQIGVI